MSEINPSLLVIAAGLIGVFLGCWFRLFPFHRNNPNLSARIFRGISETGWMVAAVALSVTVSIGVAVSWFFLFVDFPATT